jgi:transcriptional regulator with XRE-family HTH domain
LNQRYIAEKIGLSANGLSNALNRDNISLLQMQRIAESINCKLVIELQELDNNSES